jgi:integrase
MDEQKTEAEETITKAEGPPGVPPRVQRRHSMRGLGRTFKRGAVWWVAYYYRGEEKRESSGSDKESDARKLLKKRLGEIGRGRLIGPSEEKVTFEDLEADLIRDYKTNAKKSLRSAKLSARHLSEFFRMSRAIDITTDRVRAYIAQRQAGKASNASINRELAALKRMFSLAVQAGKLSVKPYVPMLEENNARTGFLDHASFVKLWTELPEYLQDPVAFLYFSGWRVSEMKSLEWRDVDAAGKIIRLRPEVSKNKDGRVLPLQGELLDIIERAREGRLVGCPFVFHRSRKRIGDFRKAWRSACKAAKLPGFIVHDLRRTAVRNLVRAGVSEGVAMKLSGHKTRSVFERYNVVDEADLLEASEKLQEHLSKQPTKSTVVDISTARKQA